MATYTPAQIASVARDAGFTGDGLIWAVAVALAESSGRTDVVNVNADGSRDRGLWQFNSKWHAEVTDAQAFNPKQAAAAAYRISARGSNWREWATYKNGSAQKMLSIAAMAAEQTKGEKEISGTAGGKEGETIAQQLGLPGADEAAALAQSLQTLGTTAAAIGSTWVKAAKWMSTPRNWLRVIEVVGGGVLLVIAINAMGRTGAGPVADGLGKVVQAPQRVAKEVAGAVGVGKITKGMK